MIDGAADSRPDCKVPPGYLLLPRNAFQGIPGGLVAGGGLMENETECWHVRVRNRFRRQDTRRWIWIWEQDSTATARYRRRAWLSCKGEWPAVDHAFDPICADPHCINPAHLILVQRPKAAPRQSERGRWDWIGEGPEEYYGWIPDPEPAPRQSRLTQDFEQADQEAANLSPEVLWQIRRSRKGADALAVRHRVSCPTVRAIRQGRYGEGHPPAERTAERARGEASGRSRLTAKAVEEIRAARGVTQVALAARYGVSAAAIRKVLSGRSWAHL